MFVVHDFTDVDECLYNPCNAQLNSTCENTDGSFRCNCPTGFEGDGISHCRG